MVVTIDKDVQVALDRAGAEVMLALMAETNETEADHRHRAQGLIGSAIRAISDASFRRKSRRPRL